MESIGKFSMVTSLDCSRAPLRNQNQLMAIANLTGLKHLAITFSRKSCFTESHPAAIITSLTGLTHLALKIKPYLEQVTDQESSSQSSRLDILLRLGSCVSNQNPKTDNICRFCQSVLWNPQTYKMVAALHTDLIRSCFKSSLFRRLWLTNILLFSPSSRVWLHWV